jgi:hypothetical protein
MWQEWARISLRDRQKVPLAELMLRAVVHAGCQTVLEQDKSVSLRRRIAVVTIENFSISRSAQIGRRIAKCGLPCCAVPEVSSASGGF